MFLLPIFDALFVIYGAKFVRKSIFVPFIVNPRKSEMHTHKLILAHSHSNTFTTNTLTRKQANSLAIISLSEFALDEIGFLVMETKRNQHDA